MKRITLMLKPNVDLMFEAYCRAKGMAPQDVLNELISRLVSENEQFIYDWLRKADVSPEKNMEKSIDEVPVHNVYKGKRYEAIFSPSRRQVNLNGHWMNPSPAAMAITVYPANGWIFWKCIDEVGREQPIDKFRKPDGEDVRAKPDNEIKGSQPSSVEQGPRDAEDQKIGKQVGKRCVGIYRE